MGKIILEQMEFFAYHGCFEEEQVIGNQFLVDLEFETETIKAQQSDWLGDTVDYQEVYNLVRAEVEKTSHILEHLGRRILDSVKSAYPDLRNLKVRVSKMNPPMGGKMKAVTLELRA